MPFHGGGVEGKEVKGSHSKKTHVQALRVWMEYASVVLPTEFTNKGDWKFFRGQEEQEEGTLIYRYHGQREINDWGGKVLFGVVLLSKGAYRMCAQFRRCLGKLGKQGGAFHMLFIVGMMQLTMKANNLETKGTRTVTRGKRVLMMKKITVILMFFVVLWFGAKGYEGEGPTPRRMPLMEGTGKEVLLEENAATGREGIKLCIFCLIEI